MRTTTDFTDGTDGDGRGKRGDKLQAPNSKQQGTEKRRTTGLRDYGTQSAKRKAESAKRGAPLRDDGTTGGA